MNLFSFPSSSSSTTSVVYASSRSAVNYSIAKRFMCVLLVHTLFSHAKFYILLLPLPLLLLRLNYDYTERGKLPRLRRSRLAIISHVFIKIRLVDRPREFSKDCNKLRGWEDTNNLRRGDHLICIPTEFRERREEGMFYFTSALYIWSRQIGPLKIMTKKMKRKKKRRKKKRILFV